MIKVGIVLAAVAVVTTGCATKEYVHEYVDGKVVPISKRVDGFEGRLGTAEATILSLNHRADVTDAALKDHASQIEAVSRTAKEALDRAVAAGKLAEGKLLYEVVLTDDTLRFKFESAELTADGKKLLDGFADKLKAENKNVYIEIQGHTDKTGADAINLKLSADRAEAVKRYLNMKCGIPLHRLATIGYGESAPIADNKSRDGRAKNRRVVLAVLH